MCSPRHRHEDFVSIFTKLALAIALLAAGMLPAQTVTGSIYGTVKDATGAAIPGATITVTNIETNAVASAKTTGTGEYLFPVLDPGTYKASATMAGFETVVQTNLRVAANQNVDASFSLPTGAVDTQVTVEGATTLVDTRESQLAETVDQRLITDLPLISRNAYDLVQLVPGITGFSEAAPIGDTIGTSFSTNGLRVNFNSFYLDGAYDTEFFRGGGNILPPPDSLQEFRIITSNFDAEFGRYPGAVVNVITRSGTNQFHGVAYDYLRNNIFNSRNYFSAPSQGAIKYIQNIFGGGVGGPIKRNKLFFFGSYQGYRFITDTTINAATITVPTDLERTGNFSLSTTKPKLPTSVQCGTTALPVICPAALDKATQNLLKYVPHADPAVSTATANHPDQQEYPTPSSYNQKMVKLDYQLNQAHRVQFTYFSSQGDTTVANQNGNQILAFSVASTHVGQTNYVLGDDWVVSPHAVNTARVFYTLSKSVAADAVQTGMFSDLGLTIPNGGVLTTQPAATVTGYFLEGGARPNDTAQLSMGAEDTFNYTRGAHSLKYGGSFIYNRYNETTSFLSSSKETFNGSAAPNGQAATGSALADFLLGYAQTFQQNNGSFHRLHADDPSLFVQDDWRVSHRFTANLGLRWEIYYPFSGQGVFGTFIPGQQSKRFPTAPIGLLSEGDPGAPPGLLFVSLKKFAPRVGFAYDVLGNGTLSLRGAYGLFYSFSQEPFVGNLEQQPFELSVTLNSTTQFVNPYAGQKGFPVSPYPYTVNPTNPVFNQAATFAGIRPYSSAIPYVQQYNLTLEQQLGTDWAVRVAYVGNVGRHFYVNRDQNSPIYSATATTANAPTRRPYYSQGYSQAISMLDPIGNSSYNSMQITVKRQLRNNFSLLASYVWSKDIDNLSADPGSATDFSPSDQYNIGRDRGLSTLDVPQRFVASIIYQLPSVHRFGLLGREALNGWQANSIVTLATGNAFNIVSNHDSNFDTILTGDRPNVVGNPFLGYGRPKLAKIAEFFNTAAYVDPAAGVPYGDSPRDPLVGPGTVNMDLSAFKRFQIYERLNLLFRADSFNLFNNTNLGNPNGTLTAATFGHISSAAQARIFQFALKAEF